MDEQSIFLTALEKETLEARAQWLSEACGTDHALKARIEALIERHHESSSFLEQVPAEFEATIIPDNFNQDRARALKAGLAAAFEQDQSLVIGNAGHSVLKSLGQSIHVPRVALRESKAERHDPIVRPKSAEMPQKDSDSRYQLQGEIARGGMGAILKGRDTDLGRDLAIKVLLDQHKDKPEVVQRFVEEAQIGGQLQHPGIAPIYELGQFADKRPFIAMKLVKGETLSKLLADRKEAAAERGKFIGIFEQICQTMAYAHSRGVIHRDLKPANIMVGAFGEVQVMDWGLAKVLPTGGVADEKTAHNQHQGQSIIQTLRSKVGSDVPGTLGSFGSQTQMGSVMGTPAYMPPEQALGEIDNLDERADVFGLGAILCEILTGKPPYVADDGTRVYRMASRGKLDSCFERLGVCEADEDLVALTKHCLELEPKNRPRHAGELAERVSVYLESVETKLREAEVARAAQEVRAVEEIKRRRVSLALAASVLLLVGLGSSAWLYMLRQEANRQTAEADVQRSHAVEMEALAEQRDDQRKLAEHARTRETELRKDADAARDSAQKQIVKLDVATATRYAERREYDTALHWVAKAWQDDVSRLRPGEKLSDKEDANHRLRVGNAIDKVNQLTGLCPHDRSVVDADCDPSGERVVSLVGDNLVQVWDAERAAFAYPPLQHDGKVNSAEFSVSGFRIVTGSEDGSARIWDAATGNLLNRFNANGPVRRTTLSPDGTVLAATAGESVILWDTTTGLLRGVPIATGSEVIYVAYSPDGGRLVTQSTGAKGTVRVWDATTREPLSDSLPSPRFRAEDTSNPSGHIPWFENRRWPTFSRDGSALVFADGFRLREWTREGVKEITTHSEPAPKLIDACFASDSRLIYFVMWPEHALYRLDPKTVVPVRLTSGSRLSNGLRLSPDGQWAAVSRTEGNVDLYRLPSGEAAGTLPASHTLRQFRFTRDSRRLMTASDDGMVRVWSLPGLAGAPKPYRFDCGRADQFASPTRRRSPDGKWEALKTPTGIQLGRVDQVPGDSLPETAAAGAFQFTPNGAHLIVTQADCLEAWWVRDAGSVRKGVLKDRRVVRTAFSRDGRRIATLSLTEGRPQPSNMLEVWELPEFRRLLGPVGENLPIEATIDLNFDGTLVVAGQISAHGPPCWNVESGRAISDIHLRGGNGLPRFGERDDRILISMTSGETFQWDVRADKPAGPTIRPSVYGEVAYSPDQTKILIPVMHGHSVYDSMTGEQLASLPSRLSKAWFSADGERIIFMTGDNEALDWTLPKFTAPLDQLLPLVELVTGTQADSQGGFASLAHDAPITQRETLQQAFRAWKGLPLNASGNE